jgi:hypothetical protein
MVWYSVQERSRAGCGFSGYLSGYLSGCFPRRPTRMHHADSLASPRSVVDMQTLEPVGFVQPGASRVESLRV